MIPSTKPEMIIHYGDPVCCGQFSDDGNCKQPSHLPRPPTV